MLKGALCAGRRNAWGVHQRIRLALLTPLARSALHFLTLPSRLSTFLLLSLASLCSPLSYSPLSLSLLSTFLLAPPSLSALVSLTLASLCSPLSYSSLSALSLPSHVRLPEDKPLVLPLLGRMISRFIGRFGRSLSRLP